MGTVDLDSIFDSHLVADVKGIRAVRGATVRNIISTDDPGALLASATIEAGLPTPGHQFALFPLARLTGYEVRGYAERDVKIGCVYESPAGFGINHAEDRWYSHRASSLMQEETSVDVNRAPLLVNYPTTVNNEPQNRFRAYKGRRPVSLETLTLTGIFTNGLNQDHYGAQCCINADQFGGHPPGTVLCINVQQFPEVLGATWRRVAQFHYSPFGWDAWGRWIDPLTRQPPTDITQADEIFAWADTQLPFVPPGTQNGDAQLRMRGLTRGRILHGIPFVPLFDDNWP